MKKSNERKDPPTFYFEEDEDFMPDDSMFGLFQEALAVSGQQLNTALELTKTILNHTKKDSVDEQYVFSIFRQATQIVEEISPLKKLLQREE